MSARKPAPVLLPVLFAVLLTTRARAASRDDNTDTPYWRTNLFKRVVTDQKFLLTRWWPEEIKRPAFACTLVAGLALVAQSGTREGGGADLRLETAISSSARSSVQGASHVLTRLGNGTTVAALLGVTYLSSRHAQNDRMAESSSLAAESLLDAGIWIEVIKAVSARARPGQSDAASFFHYRTGQNGSFPSGHSMGAFAVASVFAGTYREKKWVSWVSYASATLIGASRLVLGRHFPGDVLVGAVLGTSIGRGVVARSEEETPLGSFPSRGTIGPVTDSRGHVGVGWSLSW